jgi:hypothetical protein
VQVNVGDVGVVCFLGGRRWKLIQNGVEHSESATVIMVVVVEILSESFRRRYH